VLGAREGQSLTVSLLPQNADTHFNIFVPGGELLYESARGGQDQNQYRGQLLTTGDHTVTVYYLGAAETAADYAINFVIE
jgi:hypothetical protein